MAPVHAFGGKWTDDKLNRLSEYLTAYLTIFKANERAKKLRTTFVDAFAGTGDRASTKIGHSFANPVLSEDIVVSDDEAQSFQKGSARIALELSPGFDKYLFVEKKVGRAQELERLRSQYPAIASRVQIINGDANTALVDWCNREDWRGNRAVVFLDPYGMNVPWSTIETIPKTEAIDLWLLFPLGQAVNRLLTRNGPPNDLWADKLTSIFGTSEWREEFYKPSMQLQLFDETPQLEKEADFEQIGAYFVKRLESVFAKVASNPLPLRNSKNVPIYLFCFASANPKGAPTAVKIAQHILKMKAASK